MTSKPTFMKSSNMQFGISTYILKEYPVSEALEMISRMGFKSAEVWIWQLLKAGEPPDEIRRQAQALGMALILHGPPIQTDDGDPQMLTKSLQRVEASFVTA